MTGRTPLPRGRNARLLDFAPSPPDNMAKKRGLLKGESQRRDRDPLLEEREATHGDFTRQAGVAQALKRVMRETPNWALLPDWQKEAFELKATKLARHLCGNPYEPEHLTDDAGYAKLVLERLPARKRQSPRKGR